MRSLEARQMAELRHWHTERVPIARDGLAFCVRPDHAEMAQLFMAAHHDNGCDLCSMALSFPLTHADPIIVFGGSYQVRSRVAADLYRRGLAAKVLVS